MLQGRADARKGVALAASAFLLVVLASVALIASPSVGGREGGVGGAAAAALLEAGSSSRQRSHHKDLHAHLYRRGTAAATGNADSQFLTTFKPLPVNQGPRPIVDVYAPYEVSQTP